MCMCTHNTHACTETYLFTCAKESHTGTHKRAQMQMCPLRHACVHLHASVQLYRHAHFHTCGGRQKHMHTCTGIHMTPAQTRVQVHKNACTSMRRCPDKEADVLRYSPTCTPVHTHTAAHPCTRSTRAFTQPLTSTPFDSFVLELFVQVLCSDLRGARGGPRRGGGPPLQGKAASGQPRAGDGPRRSFPGDSRSELFGLAGSSGCCLVNFIIAASLLFV